MWYLVPRLISILYFGVAVSFLLEDASLFTLHPLMMTVSIIVLMAEGIQVFYTPNIWYLALPRKKKINFHWCIQSASGVAMALGFVSIYLVKVYKGKSHFTTWHGSVGVATCVCILFSVLGGASNLYKSKLTLVVKPYILKRSHKYMGAFTFLLGLTTIGLGYASNWAEKELSNIQRPVFISILIPFGLSVLYLAGK